MAKTKEQIQIMVLGAVVVCGALVAGVFFGIKPLMSSYKKSKEKAVQLEDDIRKAKSFIKMNEKFKEDYRNAVETILEGADRMPMPVLGNYLLNMEENIVKCADGIDLKIVDVAEGGVVDLTTDSLFQVYSVRVNLFAGCNELAVFLDRIQRMNYLVSVTEISIVPLENDPMKHRVSFVVGWLTWKDPGNLPEYVTNPPEFEDEEADIDETDGEAGEKDKGVDSDDDTTDKEPEEAKAS